MLTIERARFPAMVHLAKHARQGAYDQRLRKVPWSVELEAAHQAHRPVLAAADRGRRIATNSLRKECV